MKYKLLIILSLVFSTACLSQDKTAQLDSLFSGMAKEEKFNGNVLIAEKGIPIYQKSFGLADRSTASMLNEHSIFELASVSKQFTSMGIMLLKKQGKLAYTDSLRKFFPELPYSNITIQHLLQHTSGLPDYMDLVLNNTEGNKIATNKEMISLLASFKPPVVFPPGEKWEYSNTGYALLASIIEKVSGKSFPDFLSQNIFKPLGMTNTLVFRRRYENRRLKNYAYGYELNQADGKITLPDSFKQASRLVFVLDGIVGDGTVNSTTIDLLKWDRALYTEKLISKAMLEEAFTPAITKDTVKASYGFGWGIGHIPGMGKIVSHTGGWPGYVTRIERHLDTDKTIIVLSNLGAPPPYINRVRNILYGISEPVVVKTDSSQLKEYIGEYELAPGFIITITVVADKIFAQATGQETIEIYREKDDLFFLTVVEAKLQFARDENKKVNKLTLFQNGQELEGKKID